MFSSKKFTLIIFLLLLIYGVWARMVNLTWGSPFFFHPDENNIVYAIKNLIFPGQMNPHFFAYGSFPIYVIYFTSLFVSNFHSPPFEVIAYVSRSYSAVLSIGIILSIFLIGKQLYNKYTATVGALLSTVSVGFIQYAHFGTFEMWLTFLSLWFFYLWYLFTIHPSLEKLFFLGVISGLLLGTKVSTVILFALPFLSIVFLFVRHEKKYEDIAKYLLIYALPLVIIFFVTNPFVIFDFSSFYSSINYESSVALGTLPVFYTQGFVNTIPIIFQFLFVYPFLLNPLTTVLFLVSILVLAKHPNKSFFYVLIFFAFLFFSQSFLFVKWTRYMVPTLPFIYLLVAHLLSTLHKKWRISITIIVIGIGFFYSLAYLHTTYLSADTRVRAAAWASSHIPQGSDIISEPYDLGIIPFNGYFPHIALFDFYSLDSQPSQKDVLYSHILPTNQAIILPSQRLVRSRTLQKNTFQLSGKFYTDLFNNQLPFKKIYQTQCDIWCKIVYMGNPVTNVEETATVFDHPFVFIFEKK